MKHFLTTKLETYDDPNSAIDAFALVRFIDGSQPWAKTVRLGRVHLDAPLAPVGHSPRLVAIQKEYTTQLFCDKSWTLRVIRWRDRSASLSVTASTEAIGMRVLLEAQHEALDPAPVIETRVRTTFTHLGQRGPRRVQRNIDIEPWSSVRRNYSQRVVRALDSLMAISPESLSGRLLLMHGPPGTGKTTAIRALANAWRTWCDLEVVIDPELLMRSAGYLSSFMARDDEDEETDDAPGRWRLILLEDCDDLIRANGGSGGSHALAPLLNLTDGILGQGLRLLVGITTNEPIVNLHPAVTRPGRCIAEIEVGRLSAGDVADRMAAIGRSPREMSLAELIALEGSNEPIAPEPSSIRLGQYL